MAWQKAAALSELSEGGVIGVHVNATPIALYQLDGAVYATDGVCTHAMAILADGFVEDGKIECPLHQGLFDIKSGKALAAPATEDLRTYAVKVEDGEIFVDLDRAAEAQTPAATRAAQQSSIVSAASGARAPARADTEARDITVPGTLSNRYIWPAEGLS